MMKLLLINRRGFISKEGHRYISYLYMHPSSGRKFSVCHKLGNDTLFINELDETFAEEDNIYSTITANSLNESKRIINSILNKEYGVLYV